MAPGRARPGAGQRTTRRSTRRRGAPTDDGIPAIYGDMLAEAVAEESAVSPSLRSPKRRKMASDNVEIRPHDDRVRDHARSPVNQHDITAPLPKLQPIVYDDFQDSDESDVEFEDVDLEPALDEPPTGPEPTGDEPRHRPPASGPLELDLSDRHLPRRAAQRRKVITAAQRTIRREIHQTHLVCLLAHLSARNRWCDRVDVQEVMKDLVPRKITALLHVDESKPQYQRSHSFLKGIEEVCAIWRLQWSITARGMRRAHWKDDLDVIRETDEAEDLIDLSHFLTAAQTRAGSRDLGAQLFCALLRAVAVDARMVCSLQVLPFSGATKPPTPEKPTPHYHHAPPQQYDAATQASPFAPPARPSKKKKIVESPFPVFWVEVFSPAASTWLPLDPLVRNTINKPKTGFEPPAADQLNAMTYVVAFEDDGSAKDVTRRYTQWYNAKTRKQRVEGVRGGDQWWARVMAVYQKPFLELRDEIEDACLLRKAESEAMPRSIQDFKGHPVYVLERHLRVNEVIHPKHEVGKVNTSSSKRARMESVFRRRDVHLCRTADAWYRRGRDVRPGEQSLKHVVPRRKRDDRDTAGGPVDDDDVAAAAEGMALYAEYQTAPYEPPPVVGDTIPKNGYGNLDVYVPSMIPAGAVHIRHPLASQAARVLGINYADAVTGFEFKGRQGTAVFDGAVVSAAMTRAMTDVIDGLESQASDESEQARTTVILQLWKRWLTELRVRERVHRQYGDREEAAASPAMGDEDHDDETYRDDGDGEFGGGFMPDVPEEPLDDRHARPDTQLPLSNWPLLEQPLPTTVPRHEVVVVPSPNKLPRAMPTQTAISKDAQTWGVADDAVVEQGMESIAGGGFIPDGVHGGEGGGFLLDHEDGGGFIDDRAILPPANAVQQTESPTDQGQHTVATGLDGTADLNQPTLVTAFNGTTDLDNGMPATADKAASPRGPTESPAIGHGSDAPETSVVDEGDTSSPLQSPDRRLGLDPHQDTPSPRSETSLLSHDPDEEDAEPEWLLESLGEMD